MNVFFKTCLSLALPGLLTACDSYKNDTPSGAEEAEKDFTGTWTISKVSRNNIDITESLQDDIPDFKLEMKADGTYEITYGMPFIVEENGTWTVDDPRHPFVLFFTENGAQGSVDVEIKFPISGASRQLSMTHSPGCDSNYYEYLLERAN